ncbi:MAG: NmrA family NAD(P)-binding protein [Bacteroidota bacterium]
MSKVLLFNATGAQGGTIASRLMEEGYEVISPVRSAEKVASLKERGIEGILTDFKMESLKEIVAKADNVVLQIPAQVIPSVMVDIADNAIQAINNAGKPDTIMVISSTIAEKETGVPSVDARVKMVKLAKKYLPNMPILSSTEYLENFSTAYREPILNNGVIPQTIPPSSPVNYLSWSDLASYVVAALKSNNLEGKVYPIGGNEGLTGNDLSLRLGKVLNKELHYAPVTHEQLQGILTPILGEEVAKDYAEFYHWQDGDGAHLLNPDTSEIREKLGVELPSFEEWAKEAFAL